jgi:hypothetical protein
MVVYYWSAVISHLSTAYRLLPTAVFYNMMLRTFMRATGATIVTHELSVSEIYFMRTILLLVLSLCVAGAWAQPSQEVNAVLHDDSYLAAFGTYPDPGTDEQLRIETHLSYVEQLLRKRSVDHLSAAQRNNRSAILDVLQQYREAGVFPVNRDYPGERRPCFIDADGNICAVGYLIEQTKGRALAEQINEKHQYDYLLNMNEEVIAQWADEYGLTLEECAMIQPAYGPIGEPRTDYMEVKTGYGVSSAITGGANLALTIANVSAKYKNSPALPYIGLVTGTAQIILGATSFKKSTVTGGINDSPIITTSYKAQNNLSYINIAAGATTVISSAINLVMQKKNKDQRSSFNLYSYPGYNNSVAMGISFSRRM